MKNKFQNATTYMMCPGKQVNFRGMTRHINTLHFFS